MIKKIKRLKSIGKFYDYAATGVGLDWGKNTFVIAPNAYGKSTLVNVLRSMRENDSKILRARKTLRSAGAPQAIIIVDGENCVFNGTKWDKPIPEIQIFDVPFIHDNILSHEIGYEHKKSIHKIIIGAQGVKLANELSELKANEKIKKQALDGLKANFAKGGFVHHTLDAFLAIPAEEEAAVPGRIQQLQQDIKSKESEATIQRLGFPSSLSSPAFDLTTKTLASRKLEALHEDAQKRVRDQIDRNIKDKEAAKEFIRLGLELLQADCPFCGQDLNNAGLLMKAYQEFFDDAFRTYQKELEEKAESLSTWNLDNALTTLVSKHHANTVVLRQWEPSIGIETLPDVAAVVDAARTKVIDLKTKVHAELEKKRKDPTTEADISPLDSLASELASLQFSVEAYNQAVAAFTEKGKAYVSNLAKSNIESIRAALEKEREVEKRFSPEWKQWSSDYPICVKEVADATAAKAAKQADLENYTKTIFSTYQTRINQLLEALGADFQMTDLMNKTEDRASESYADFGFLILQEKVPLSVRRDDAPCFRNTLSEGDKTTLAFAFFVAALEKIPELHKQVVILDDPLSSLDETRREGTARILLDLSPKTNQLCVLTHKRDFLRMLFDKIPENVVLQVKTDKKNGSWFEPFDVEDDRKSNCARLLEEMKRYVDEDFGPNPEIMQGNIRKVFESVLKTKYYLPLAADIKAKKGLGKLLQTLFARGLLDITLKPQLFNLCSVADGPHHGDIVDAPSKNLTRSELIPLIREALDLLLKV